ncbi:glycosyltransferase family 9 protein [Flavobacteriaceae bacterium TP-CH-4]|uniref:Glycosyltransferase family 9 protein n=2 Tax=Pelagihabitans pacificus TaxID=2696054 RepID=A0A967EA53_9FLAO|nr:glycosyltransferase family 9 protein [Pelagihabitans pacificus]
MDKKEHILVMRLSAMGDVAMTVPLLVALQRQYPTVKITVLTRGFFSPMFSQLSNTHVFPADLKGRHKGVFGLFRLYKELKALGIERVADLHNVLRSNVLKRYFLWGGFPFFQIDKGRAGKKTLTAARNKVFEPLKTTHQRYADVFVQMGYPLNLSVPSFLSKETLSNTAHALVGRNTQKWLGIAPFAAYKGKQYPIELMQQVITSLQKTKKYKVLLFGGGKEEQLQLEKMAADNDCTSVAGQLSFAEELALISNLDLMVAMDSGNAHLAAMYGIPVITLWGITHPFAGFYPFGQEEGLALLADRERFPLIPTSVYGNKAPKGYEKAIASIPPEKVVEKIQEVLTVT